MSSYHKQFLVFIPAKSQLITTFLIGQGRDIWRWMSVNTGAGIKSRPHPTHLSQRESCVMISGVWTAVCLAVLRHRVQGWVSCRDWVTRQERKVSFYIPMQLTATTFCGNDKGWREEILMSGSSSLNWFRKSASTANTPQKSSFCDLRAWFNSGHHYRWKQSWWWLELEPLTLWYKSHYSRQKTKGKFLGFADAETWMHSVALGTIVNIWNALSQWNQRH